MNKKQFLILLGLVIVLGLWGIARWHGQTSSWSGGGNAVGQKLLGEFDVNAVAQLAIKQGTNELLLAKKDEVWRVAQRDNYPANFSEISSVLLKLKNLKIVQTEQVGASQLPRLELAASGSNAPTVVEFRDAGGQALKTLTLGKKHMRSGGQSSPMDEMSGGDGGFPDGRYVQVSGMTDRAALISDPLSDVEPSAGRWLSKSFFKVEKPKSIAVTFIEATNSWKLVRETEGGDLKFAEAKTGEELDSSKASGAANPFSAPSFNDVIIGATSEQTGLDKPTLIAIETFDGFNYTIKVGAKQDDNYHIALAVNATLPKVRPPETDEKPEDKEKLDNEFAASLKKLEEKLAAEKAFEPWIFLVSSWTVDSILKNRADLLVTKAETAAETPPRTPPVGGTGHEGHNHP
jgi:hypothetical protein